MRHPISRTLVAIALVTLTTALVRSANAQTAPADLIAAIQNPQTTDEQRWQAATDLGAATFTDATERQAALDALTAACQANEIGLKVNAALALGQLRDPSAESVLTAGLKHSNGLVRQASARALGRIGTSSAAEALLSGLRDPNPTVRVQIVRALGDAGQPIAVGVLEERLASPAFEESAGLRNEVVRSLEHLGGYAVEALLRAMSSNDDALRRRCAEALGRIADPRASRPLTAHLGDRNAGVAMAATQALGRIGEPAITPLIEALEQDDTRIQQNAITALIAVGTPAVAPLGTLYQSAAARIAELEDERAEAIAAAQALSQPQPSITPLPSGQTMTDSEIKRELSQSRKRLKALNEERERAEQLVFFRRTADVYSERINAAGQVLASGDTRPFQAQSPLVAGIVPYAYGPTEYSLSPNAFRPSFTTSDAGRSVAAVDEDISKMRRRAHTAILAIGGVGTDASVTALLDILQNAMVDEATLAAEALGHTRNPNAVAPLASALADVTYPSSVRANAARSLGRLEAIQAQAALDQAATTDPSSNVREAAREALQELGVSPGA